MAEADADLTRPSVEEPAAPPPRESVSLKETDADEPRASPAERTFETRASRLRLSDDEHADLATRLETVLKAIEDERAEGEWDANWDLFEDLYYGVLPERPAGQANIHLPIAQETVDTALAVVEQGLFSANPWLQIRPREPMDVASAKRKEDFLDHALTAETQAKEKLEPILFEAGVLGTGVAYLPWLRETDRIRDQETYDGLSRADLARFDARYPDADEDFPDIVAKLRKGKTVTLTVEYTEARQDAPDPTYIPLRDWLVRPAAKWHQLHRERFVGHRIPLRYAQLEELVDDGYYDDRLQRLAFRWQEDGTYVDDPAWRDKPYEVSVGILRWRRKGDARERRYLVDFHRESRTVLRALHYPYWHNRVNYIPWYFQRSPRSIYGISLVQKVEQSQFLANAANGLLLDAIAFGAIPMFAARESARGKFNPMVDGMYAGKTWYFDNPESDVKRFDAGVPAGVGVLANLIDRATRHAELASGASQNVSGLASGDDPDAPGNKTQMLIQQAYVRIGKYLATLGWSLSELGFQMCELYYQFSPAGRQYRVMGPEGVPVFETIPRSELRLRADFVPHGSTAALNPDKQKREVLELGAQLLQSPDIQASPLRRWTVIEMLLDAAGDQWRLNKGKLLPAADEVALMKREEEIKLKLKDEALRTGGAAGASAPTPGGASPVPQGTPTALPPPVAALLQGAANGNRLPGAGAG